MKGIADTGFLVAFRNRTDHYHRWAVDVAHHVTEPLLTCESVLSEATFQIGSAKDVFSLVEDGLVRLAFDLKGSLKELQVLATRYAERHPDLADLCLIRMSELYPRHTVITVDEDFRVYRRNKREAIPVLCPPKK
jgi:uncharacterized protein